MRVRIQLIACLIGISTLSLASVEEEGVSAYRNPKIPYSVYEERALLLDEDKTLKSTPLNTAILYSSENAISLPKATSWKSSALQERFEKLRDERFMKWSKRPNFLRRSSWLFPDDGCYARASMAVRNSFQWFLPVPKKVFAFGSLKVKTKNSRKGYVTWWYHVAPIVEVKNKKYVLDPSIEPTRPLELGEWLGRMGKPEKMKVAICKSGTYSPSDNCEKDTDGLETRAARVQNHFFSREWDRLVKLGRKPEVELGENPPW